VTRQTRLDLERKFGIDSLVDFCTEVGLYGGNYKALTEPEAFFLARSPSLDAARNRIIVARHEREREILSEGIQGSQTPDRTVTPEQQTPDTLHSPEAPFLQDSQLTLDFSSPEKHAPNPLPFARPVYAQGDFIHKTIIKPAEPQSPYTIIGKRISLLKSGCPSSRGWKELYDTLAIYRNKQYETFRYLFINNNGEIADHLAVTSRHPSMTAPAPAEFSNFYFMHLMEAYAAKNGYGIVVCHNHPSGETWPSEEDREVTETLKSDMGSRFRGHIILDHGKFSFCGEDNNWTQIDSPGHGKDPLLDTNEELVFGIPLKKTSDLALIKAALQVDGGPKWNDTDWIAVVFLNHASTVSSLHYYHKSDFTRADAPLFLIDKTVRIAELAGSTMAFPITDNADMFDTLYALNRKIHLFTDFYVNGKTLDLSDEHGSISHYMNNKIIQADATFPLPAKPVQEPGNSLAAAEMTVASPSRNYNNSIPRSDLLKWGAVNTPVLYKQIITLNENIQKNSSNKIRQKQITKYKRESFRLTDKLKNIHALLEIERFDNALFESDINTVFNTQDISKVRYASIYFGHIPPVLSKTGLPNSSLYMKAEHLFTSMKGIESSQIHESFNYHNISPDIIKKIPDSLKNPLYIFQSNRFPTSLVVVLDLYNQDNNPVIVPITPFRKISLNSCEVRYNSISSIYGKSRFETFLENHKNLILYEDKKRNRPFRPRERQSPRVAWEHRISGFYEDNIQHYKNSVKDYVEKTGLINPAFLAEPEAPYGAPQYTFKELPMYDFTGNVSALSRPLYSALIEYLEKMNGMQNIEDIRKFHGSLTSIPEFAFINEYVPPPGDRPFDQYQAMAAQLHTKGFRHYRNLYHEYPPPEHLDYSRAPQPQAEGPGSSPARFLEAARNLADPGDYAFFNQQYNHFPEGSIKAVSSRHIAFFQGNNKIPDITDNTPENWAKLFNRANNFGVAVNNIIPHPVDVAEQGDHGMELIHDAFTALKNNMSRDFHAREFSRHETLAETQAPYPFPGKPSAPAAAKSPQPASMRAEQRKLDIFVQNAYVPGTEVPEFTEMAGGVFIPHKGYRFARTENANQSIILQKEGRETAVSSTLYNHLITNTASFLNEKHITPEITERYEQAIGADRDKTRVNIASNFWHNYRVLCREQASNPQEAMEIAKSIIREMPCEEQEKFKAQIKSYEKTSRPPETYNQRILKFYEENVKDLPVDHSIFARNSIPSINRTVDVIEKRGDIIDPRLRIKIGDTLNLNVAIDDLLTNKKKSLDAKNLVLVSASNDLNKVILVDKENRSKYVLAKDEFVSRVQKLEKQQQKTLKKERKYESIGY
jgi:proteasome lid subunit RPN8/RPN11